MALEVCAESLPIVVRLLVHEHDVSIVHRIQLQVRRPPASIATYLLYNPYTSTAMSCASAPCSILYLPPAGLLAKQPLNSL